MHVTPEAASSRRLLSIDAYRGLVMFLMMAEVLHLCRVSRALPESGFWAFLCHHQDHVAWVGCSLHDLIQPSFSFLVGVALPFSLAARQARGQSLGKMTAHAFWRAAVLVMLGIFLRSIGRPQTNFTFEDTLTQIGLGYGFLFLLGMRPTRDQWVALALVLVGYWGWFAWYPLPGPDFDWAAAGVAADWPHHLNGFAAHWSKNANPAAAFDVWFLNLFPRPEPFRFNGGGYLTLSFIPTLGTMILGVIAGGVIRTPRLPWQKVRWLAVAGVIGLAAGWGLGALGICPVVKRIWTPSWVLFSGGWCFLFLAAFYALIEIGHWSTFFFPLMVIGMNSIAIYCMTWMWEGFMLQALKTHVGAKTFAVFGPAYESLISGTAVLLVFWLILYWMYRRKLFLKI
jgi:predicted acyltransferase